ncbi:copper amine oxidase [Georgenia deserti]|uniref:Amine oxidase n=1 Tax=Georgenia deserti TaxID=2093781 RepID=A0ABW4L741_9MICO
MRTTIFAAGVLALAACTSTAPDDADSGAPAGADTASRRPECDSGEPLTETLSNDATWSLCWSVDPQQGLVLTDINYTPPGAEPIHIAHSMAVAQLEVPYDSGERNTEDITDAGFGGTAMQTLTETECTGELVAAAIPNIGDGTHGSTPTREVLCSEVADGGLAYRLNEGGEVFTDRRTDWTLTTISKVGWYEYLTVYTFGPDGSIRPSLGATGDLSPADYTDPEHGSAVGPGQSDHAASHSHNVVWSIHWALDGEGGLAVEQYDADPTGETGPEAPILEGALTEIPRPAIAQWTDRRWWRVLNPSVRNADDHPISYQIDLEGTDSFTFARDQEHHGPDTGYDVAFTNHDPCEVYATGNRGQCGAGVLDYVEDGADEPLDDVVSWVAVGFHHVPRDEDQSPMEMHWQGFGLTPRDLTATRPDAPQGREGINGQPEDSPYLNN